MTVNATLQNSIGLDKNQSAKMKKHITSEKVIEDSIKKWKIMIEKTKKKKIDGGRKRKTKKHRRKKRGKRKTQKVQRGGNGILTSLYIMTGIIGISAGLAFVLSTCYDVGGACLDRILPITPTEEDNYYRQEQQRQRQERQQHNRRVQQRARQRLLDYRQQEEARRRRQSGDYDSDKETKESAAHARDR